MVSLGSPNTKILKALLVIALIVLAVGSTIFAHAYESAKSKQYLEYTVADLESHITRLTLEITKLNIGQRSTKATNPSELLSETYRQTSEIKGIANIYLIQQDGTYFNLIEGNPTQSYIMTYDNLDHASKPITLLEQTFWQYYFFDQSHKSHQLWINPLEEDTFLLTIPFTQLNNKNTLVIGFSLPIDDWVARVSQRLEIQITQQQRQIWRSNSTITQYPVILKEVPETFNSFSIQGHFASEFLIYILPISILSLLGVMILTILKESKNKFELPDSILKQLNFFFIEADDDSNVISTYGYMPELFSAFKVCIGDNLNDALKGAPHLLDYLAQALKGERLTFEITEGNHAVQINLIPVKDTSSDTKFVQILIQEISDQKEIELHLNLKHLHDKTTGWPKANFFTDKLSTDLVNLKKHHQSLVLFALQINDFEHINKVFGHSVADSILKTTADELQNSIRQRGGVGRFRNDEFLIYIEDEHSLEDIETIAKRLIHICTSPHFIDDQSIILSVNIGIAIYPNDATEAKTLISNALSVIKHHHLSKRNSFNYFSTHNAKIAQDTWHLEQQVSLAIREKNFELNYQPIFDITANACIGAEALLRWPSTNFGPDQFIPIAEDSGLIHELGIWVIEQALSQLTQWRTLESSIQYLSINLSLRQLDNDKFLSQIEDLTKRYPFTDGSVVLEITESIMMEAGKGVISHLKTLKKLGFHLAIDDFGTGFSSLNYLKTMPVDYLKIDRSFIKGISIDDSGTVICESIIKLATALNLNIIAEGVESPAQMKWLISHGVIAAQGFFYAKAVAAEDFQQYLGISHEST